MANYEMTAAQRKKIAYTFKVLKEKKDKKIAYNLSWDLLGLVKYQKTKESGMLLEIHAEQLQSSAPLYTYIEDIEHDILN